MKKLSVYINNKRIFYLIVLINFVAILAYNFLTPYLSDDLQYELGVMKSIKELIADEAVLHTEWTGRDVAHFILRTFFCFPKPVFNICNSIVFVVLTLLMYANIDKQKKYDSILYLYVVVFVWLFGVEFAQTVLWVSGACNYLWTGTIIVGLITVYRRYNGVYVSRFKTAICCFAIFLLGILAGWGNENTSGGGILLCILLIADRKYSDKKRGIKPTIRSWEISGVLGALVGFVMLISSPGNKARAAERLTEENNTGILALFGRLLKLNDAVYRHFGIMICIFVFLIIYLMHKKISLYELRYVIMYASVAIITSYILIFTTIPMDRAFFGAGILLIISVVQLVSYVQPDDIYINVLKRSAIIIMVLFLVNEYIACSADLIRIIRELEERQAIVNEMVCSGYYDIVLPQIREEWNNKYTFLYHYNDIGEEEDGFGNDLYKKIYGLNRVKGIPRTEWDTLSEEEKVLE